MKNFVILALFISALSSSMLNADQIDTNTTTLPWEKICGQSKKAVIQIITIAKSPNILEPFRSATMTQWAGSGFLISDDGFIISNFHVVEKKELCFLQHPALGKKRFLLDVIGGCPEKDIALLKINDSDIEEIKNDLKLAELPWLELGDSDKVVEGEEIMALGYPLGSENFKSAKGIVSGRESLSIGECIQTTAALNHGNSGGPVVDKTGKVIGISTMGPEKSEVEGVGYLVAINDVIALLSQFNHGNILRLPYWGFEFNPTTEYELSRWKGSCEGGIFLKKIYKHSLFEEAGIAQGDILYSINDNIIDRYGYLYTPGRTDKSKLYDYLNRLEIGSVAKIVIYSKGTKKECNIIVKAREPFQIQTIHTPYEDLPPYEVIGGLVVSEFSINHINAILEQYYFDPYNNYGETFLTYANYDKLHEKRLIISSVLPDSQGDKTRCFESATDIMLSKVNNTPVKTIEDFQNAVRKSIGHPSIIFETEGGTVIELSVADIVAEEEILRERNEFYPRSSLIDELEVIDPK